MLLSAGVISDGVCFHDNTDVTGDGSTLHLFLYRCLSEKTNQKT